MKQASYMNLKVGDFVRMGEVGTVYTVSHVGTAHMHGAVIPAERDVHIKFRAKGSVGDYIIKVAEGDAETIKLLQVVIKAPPEFHAFMEGKQ